MESGVAIMEIDMEGPQNIGLHLLHHSILPLLNIYAKDSIAHGKDTCSSTFTAALFTIDYEHKQPRFPLTDE